MPESQSAAAVLMVRPACFGFNPQTAASNAFQNASVAPRDAALAEFDAVAAALRGAGIEVLIASDSATPPKPDAVFPNNWVSFHGDGTIVLYPMLAPNRRAERRDEILQLVMREGGFRVSRTVDLVHYETQGKYLEGTGSLVLDRVNRVAYVCSSPRSDLDALGDFARQLDYDLVSFDALDEAGRPIYHTNVLMSVGSRFAILCTECLPDAGHRDAVLAKLRVTGHEVVEITRGQMRDFAGNVLELASPAGPLLALSTSALAALNPPQVARLRAHVTLLPVALPYIEAVGGGGVRCMLAEIHLRKS